MTNKISTYLQLTPLVLTAIVALTGCGSDNTASSESTGPELAIGAATSADFVAVRIEAENYNALTGGWTLTSQANIPTITPDPDPPHFSTASGGAYVELLPDTRVTHDDELRNGENYWGSPGRGPQLEYNIDIPEPGRYYVFVKAYSTGAEDNGIHVGINGHKPASGYRVQLCSGKNRWTWSSAQRVDTNHCGVTKTIFVDVDTAGSHNIIFYAREDGFELDQFILIKDVNAGVTDCAPIASDKIRCVDVATGDTIGNYILTTSPTNDGNEVIVEPPVSAAIVDLQLSLSAGKESLAISEEVQYILNVDNLDDNDTATSVQALVTLPDGLDFVSSDICNAVGNQLTCIFSEITPDEQVSAKFTATPSQAGTLRVDAQVSAEQQETTLGNNTASNHIVASVAIPDYDGALSIIQGSNALGLNDHTTHLVSISNNGQQVITDAALEITGNSAVTVSSIDPACSGEPGLNCLPGSIQPGDSISIPVTLSGANTGQDNVTMQLSVNGDDDTSNNTLNVAAYVIDSYTITDDSGVITLEAESYTAQATPNASPLEGAYNSAWFVISETLTPNISPDYDSVSADATSNASYVEFLPDTRLGAADPIIMNVSNYQNGGDSAALAYNVFINTAGRYYVAVLTRANNTQDASVNVGLNNQWPDTSQSLSVCNPDGQWQWTNSTDCGTEAMAYLDIATPGVHTVQLSAATDGVEIDKITLSLDSPDLPSVIDTIPAIYSPQDIDLAVTTSVDAGVYTVTVSNLDTSATAVGIVVQLSGIDVAKANSVVGFDGCTASGDMIECTVGYIAANAERVASVNVDSSENEISASLILANDSVATNNKSTTTVKTGGGLIDLMLLLMLTLLCAIRLYSPRLQRTSPL